MFGAFRNSYRLAKAGLTLAWYGAAFIPKGLVLPGLLRYFLNRTNTGDATHSRDYSHGVRLSRAITALGPSYIKLGQFLATRPDVVGGNLADALSSLRDRLPPFSETKAKDEVEKAFGQPCHQLYKEFGPPVAAASIAQVHRAIIATPQGDRAMAVKILRPDIEKSFARDLSSFYFAARTLEWVSPRSKRLRPVAAVDMLAESVALEMDLRLEAAAISEMAENIERAGDIGFRVPRVDWLRTSRKIMTLEWIDGIPLGDLDAINRAGLDREALGLTVIRSFLRHAIRDGFFHADMHQGNLFVDPVDSAIIAVDFGIVGRIGMKERRFLAEILYGFIIRNYMRIAEVHFEAGYVSASKDVSAFAQALRAIGEPIQDRPSSEISMARLLTQLFEVTDLFEMQMRPELILLQKTMVVVEGVARSLDPSLNIWNAAEPIVRAWITEQIGPAARIRDAVERAGTVIEALSQTSELIDKSEKLIDRLSSLNGEEKKQGINIKTTNRYSMIVPLWMATALLGAITLKLWFY